MGTNCITLHINSALRHALSPTRSSPVSSVFLAILVYLCLKKFQLLLRNGTWNDVGASNCCAQWNWAEAILFALFIQTTVPTVRILLVLQIKQMVLHPCGLWHILFAYQINRSKNLFQVVFLFKWHLNTLYRALYIFSLIKNELYIVYEVADVSLCVQTRTQLPSLANTYANVWIWVQRQVIIDRITHAQLVPERKQAKLGANGKNIC